MQFFQNAQARRFMIAATTLLWVIVAIALYFYVYRPFSSPFIRSIGSASLDVVVLAIFTIVAAGLGRWIFSHLALDDWNHTEHIAADALLGYAALSSLIFLVGVAILNALVVALVLLLVAILTRRHLIGWITDTQKWLYELRMPNSGLDRLAAIVIILALITALLISLLPPTKWDVLTYHLTGAQHYVERGRFYAVPNNHFLGFPQQVDTLFAAQLALTGQLTGSSLFQWAMGSFALLLTGSMAARRFSLRAGLVAVSTIIVGKSIWLEMTYSYSDLLPIGLAAIALNVADTWAHYRDNTSTGRDVLREMQYIVLIGMTSGFAMGTRYTAVGLAAGLGILVLWICHRDHWRRILGFALAYGITASIVLGPWLVRNLVWYGNPVYPLLFSSGEMDAIRQEWYGDPGSGMIHTENAWQLPILPIAATFLGVDGKEGFGTTIGPLYLLLCPMLILTWGRISTEEKRFAIRALLTAGVITLIWILATAFLSDVNQRTRYVLYMFPLLAIVAGLSLESLYRLPQKPIHLAFIVHAMIAMVLIFAGIDYTQDFVNSGVTTYFSGSPRYRDAYLEQKLGWYYEAIRQINALPRNSTVRFMWEPRYLYCDEDKINCYNDSLMDGWYYARRTVDDGTPESIAQAWRAEGIDYFLVYEFGRSYEEDRNQFYTSEDWVEWDSFVNEFLEETWSGGNRDNLQYVIYKWNSETLAN